MIQILFEELGKSGFLFYLKRHSKCCLTHLFFAHPDFVTLNRSYSIVFVMDSTYNTNLLNAIGRNYRDNKF